MCSTIMIAMIASTAMQAVGQIQQGREAKATANYQADQAAADAAAERGAAQVQAEKIRKAGDQARGQATAALAASGASVESASADAIDADIVSAYEEDALVSMYSGDNAARSRQAEGDSYRIAGRRAARNATWEAAGTVASGWYRSAAYSESSARLSGNRERAGSGTRRYGPDESEAETARLLRSGRG